MKNKEFFQYVIPSMLAFALSGVYAIADGFFVGNAMGDHALAAINIAFPMTAFLQAIGTGLGMGGAIRYAICKGSKDEIRGRQYFGIACILLVVASVTLSIAYYFISPTILSWFGATGEIEVFAREYMLFITYGAVFQILGCGLIPFIRNMGNSILAMVAMILGFLTNILLDYLLVWVIPWGMMGAAIATAIGQGVTFVFCLMIFIHQRQVPILHFSGKGLLFIKETLLVSSSPFGLTFSPNITLILINKSAAIFGGSLAVTCYAPIAYVSSLILLLLQGVSDGAQPLLSLSYGEGNHRKVKTWRTMAYIFAIGVGIVCMVGLYVLRHQVAILFGASDQVSLLVAQLLPIFLSGYLCICISRVTTAYLYATNQNGWAYLIIYGEPLVLGLLLLLLPSLMGVMGTWICVPASQCVAFLACLFLLWKEKMTSQKDRNMEPVKNKN